MIKTEHLAPNILKIIAPKTLRSDDFIELAPAVDSLIEKQQTIRLLIDASELDGWADATAVEKHMMFVKTHQQHVERIAVIAQHEWQHWFVGAVRVFLHPGVKVFDKAHETDALRWLAD